MHSFDLRHTPFSCAGSPLHIGLENFGQGRRLVYETTRRSVWSKAPGGWGSHFFRLDLLHGGRELDYHTRAAPHQLELIHDDASAQIAFADPQTLLLRVCGGALRLHTCHVMGWCLQPGPREARFYDHAAECVHHLRIESGGSLRVQRDESMGRGPKSGAPACGYIVTVAPETDQPAVLAMRTTLTESTFDQPLPSFAAAAEARRREYAAWEAKLPAVSARYRAAAEFAWHMLWNQRIDPIGRLTRPAIVMSRHWMHCVWPWDACFSAIGIAEADPALAWDQVLLHLDHQLPNGQIPDAIHDGLASYGYVKPPVQGWTVLQLLDKLPAEVNQPFIRQAYDKVGRWTEWWYACRDFDGDGVCSYVHGNDSGWDNSTLFDGGGPIESPDLSAYLVLQCEALAEMARRLGRGAEAQDWQGRAAAQLDRLLTHLVEEDRFIARDQQDQPIALADSALLRVPLILGRRLPVALRRRLIRELQPDGRFLTEVGLASEATDSPHFERNGYWRGPMWAPPVYMVFDGLLALGEDVLAAQIAERFCRTCSQEPAAMFENYDSLTGAGQRCRAYSWTAAVFVRLAAWLAQRAQTSRVEVAVHVTGSRKLHRVR